MSSQLAGRSLSISVRLPIWRGDFEYAETLVDILLERSQQVFQHYHELGLLYRRFLGKTKSASDPMDCIRDFNVMPGIPAQADLFATFDGEFAGPDPLARVRADEEIWCAPELLMIWACRPALPDNHTAHDAAEAILLRSIGLARRRDARAWVLRAATNLAPLHLRSCQGRKARAGWRQC
jgi:hypothetical protein